MNEELDVRAGVKALFAAWIVGGVLVAAYIAYDLLAPRPTGSVSTVASEAPAVKHQPTAPVVVKAPIRAIQGKAKVNLKLPPAVQADEAQQVIAASQVPASLRPQTVSTVVNTETGKVESFVKTDPYPWIAYEPRGEVRLMYGYKVDPRHLRTHVAPVLRLQAGYDVVRVKALTAGASATVDSDGSAFVGVGVSYRW